MGMRVAAASACGAGRLSGAPPACGGRRAHITSTFNYLLTSD